MNTGYESTNREEFHNFLKWYGTNVYEYHRNFTLANELIFFGQRMRKIAYISNGSYMIAEDLFTQFYHDFYDK
ncbi:hypothetical protein AB3N02_21950 [Priestia aryabhattai]|uniref:hypothetical protein n=1 Tax=Priestia aryabhattai TaxID=412384 RepID=UPI00399FEE30